MPVASLCSALGMMRKSLGSDMCVHQNRVLSGIRNSSGGGRVVRCVRACLCVFECACKMINNVWRTHTTVDNKLWHLKFLWIVVRVNNICHELRVRIVQIFGEIQRPVINKRKSPRAIRPIMVVEISDLHVGSVANHSKTMRNEDDADMLHFWIL